MLTPRVPARTPSLAGAGDVSGNSPNWPMALRGKAGQNGRAPAGSGQGGCGPFLSLSDKNMLNFCFFSLDA